MSKTIVVDGASSSGRTSIVNCFKSQSLEDYRAVHIDEYLEKLPVEMWERCRDSEEGWAEIGMAFNKHIAELAHRYERLIADTFYKVPSAREHLFWTFGRDHVFYVQLFCDLSELERREMARGDRRKGLARSQFEQIYAFTEYDMQIDSTTLSIEECTQELMDIVSNNRIHTDSATPAVLQNR
jgi:chloramphenicol 3-O phosphotransferase